MAAERARPPGAGGDGALPRARVRADHGRGDRRAGRAHRAHVLPPLRRQARGPVRRRGRAAGAARQHGVAAPPTAAPIDAVAAAPGGRRRRCSTSAASSPGSARPSSPRTPSCGARADQARALAAALADALRQRGVSDPAASLAAESGIAVFKIAFERWTGSTGEESLVSFIRESMAELRAVTG